MTDKIKIIIGVIISVIMAGLILAIIIVGKSCNNYKTLSKQLQKERETANRIQSKINNVDQRITNESNKKIKNIRSTSNNIQLVNELNKLYSNGVQADENNDSR